MLKSEVSDHRPGVSPWRVMLAEAREQRRRMSDQKRKESEQRELSLDAGARMHAFDEMRHWRDPVQRPRSFPYRRRTLIDDNPSSS
jgi:hypothetical protein